MKAIRWQDTKRAIREIQPDWDSPERVVERECSREELRAIQRGHQLAQMRKHAGLTQAQLAAAMGITQARVSQIEHGKITGMDTVRAYIEALGGTVEVVAHVGDWSVKVA